MSQFHIGAMIEFPRGDRAVIERWDALVDVVHVRWIRGGLGASTEVDGASLCMCKIIEPSPNRGQP